MIKAPYNFVPLSESVFFPDWSNQISHDIPFSDGRSGILNIKITAKTPIFVRNGHTQDDQKYKTKEYLEFSQTPDGRYFIPATSIKGMVRNILEITSMGKMTHITRKRYSIRDLRLQDYLNYFRTNPIHCGWMIIDKKEEKVTIEDHGLPGRISPAELDRYFEKGLESYVKNRNLLQQEVNRTAKAKYAKFGELKGRFEFEREESPNNGGRKFFKCSKKGKPGTIVFTGQPGVRGYNKKGILNGKWYEFVFFDDFKKTYTLDMKENGVYDDFLFIYNDSVDWHYWRKRERIPVFFTLKRVGEKEEIEYMGLSYMFKLPFPKRINEYLNSDHLSKKRDLAECIFGTTEKPMLKGRVQFSHSFCITPNPIVDEEKDPLMGSPKPTYYPIYIQQKGRNGRVENRYKTFLNNDAQLRGWKKYPVREKTNTIPEVEEGQKQNTSPFRPLHQGTEFTCSIRYHNLREVELGALIYALTLTEEGCYSLGFCKPYGYGIVKIDIVDQNKEEICRLRNAFVSMMETQYKNYESLPQLCELRAMMTIAKTGGDTLEYMELKDFADMKRNKEIQLDYSCIINNKQSPVNRPYDKEKKTIQHRDNKPQEEFEAKVTFIQGKLIKATPLFGKNTNSMTVNMNGYPIRLKTGDTIIVKKQGRDFLFIRKKH